jgi:hypothetical protein
MVKAADWKSILSYAFRMGQDTGVRFAGKEIIQFIS